MPNYPFDICGIDTCGPFPEIEFGNKYIVTLIDHFSSWPEAFAVPNKSAETVARLLLEEIIPRHTCPRKLVSDRGSESVNRIVAIISERLKICHLNTSSYHPQCNGNTERFHRFLNDVMSKYAYANHSTWDKFLSGLLISYRVSVNDINRLLHARDPVLSLDTLLQPKLKYMGDEYIPLMLERMHVAATTTKQHLAEVRAKNKRIHGMKATNIEFKPGDTVYYCEPTSAPGMSEKFKLPWKAFSRTVEKVSPVNYRIYNQ